MSYYLMAYSSIHNKLNREILMYQLFIMCKILYLHYHKGSCISYLHICIVIKDRLILLSFKDVINSYIQNKLIIFIYKINKLQPHPHITRNKKSTRVTYICKSKHYIYTVFLLNLIYQPLKICVSLNTCLHDNRSML